MPLIREPEPAANDTDDEHFERPVYLGANSIRPLPASRRLFLLFALVLGLSFAGTGVGTAVAISQGNHTRRTLEHKSQLRDVQYNSSQAQIQALTTALQDQVDRERRSVCSALALVKNPSPAAKQLNRDYGCTTP